MSLNVIRIVKLLFH